MSVTLPPPFVSQENSAQKVSQAASSNNPIPRILSIPTLSSRMIPLSLSPILKNLPILTERYCSGPLLSIFLCFFVCLQIKYVGNHSVPVVHHACFHSPQIVP
ncbi:hypothetical protein BS47DRAFT_61600 [Hydnum rufescens UP504]|uniref:Uncharacterized protein n=1 Tax=Hydnum rufescens UP504 TaxID=1448309 RepID=A0A9P6AR42_9AGAM|nr:hypothetical protein BS47DRAFT_61600 [Hydnum rufescens UP504]